jgi:hypothetical protein
MTMDRKTKESAVHFQSRFCALAYKPQPFRNIPSGLESVILFVLQDEAGDLHFLVSPKLDEVVQGDDIAYIDSLMGDFIERAKLHPGELFQQLCSLSVGPLVTFEVDSHLADHPRLQELSSRFVSYPN